MQRYLLDLGFIRAPNALALCQAEGPTLVCQIIVCSALVLIKWDTNGSVKNVRDFANLQLYAYLYWAAAATFLLIRLHIRLAFKHELDQRTDAASRWIAAMRTRKTTTERVNTTKLLIINGTRPRSLEKTCNKTLRFDFSSASRSPSPLSDARSFGNRPLTPVGAG